MNVYRDPELSRLHGENFDLKLKLLTISAENANLRVLLKKEMDKNNLPPNPNLVARIMCRWFGMHTYKASVDKHTLEKLKNGEKFTQDEFFFLCMFSCVNCAHVEKNFCQDYSGSSFVKLANIVSVFKGFYREMFGQHPEWNWENAQASSR